MKTTAYILLVVTCSFGALRIVYGEPTERSKEEHVRGVIRKSLLLLERGSAGTAESRTCFTCHGQALPVMAITEARSRGFEIDEKNLQRQLDHTAAFLKRGHRNYLTGKGQGGRVDTAGYALWALEAGRRKPDEVTNAVTEYLLKTKSDSGHWKHSSNRPPSEASDFTTTYVALRALAVFGTTQQETRITKRTEAASKWLLESKASDTEDRVFQLRSLPYANADEVTQRRLADELIAEQHEDGGWAQKTDMSSDAYATGTVLTCLAQTGHLPTTGEAYQRGLQFLLKSQYDDGSWHVVSRSKPFQKYFETGFPHSKDQFVSTSATAWSTLALLLSLPEVESEENRQRDRAEKQPGESTSPELSASLAADSSKAASHRGAACLAVDNFFADEVWAKVGERTCLKCHNAKGDASDSEFLLHDTVHDRTKRDEALRQNRATFVRMASAFEDGKSRLLQKIVGDLDHGGNEVLKQDSTGYKILARFVRRASGKPDKGPAIAAYGAPPFFDGLEMMSPQRLLRRITLSLAARLPTRKERTVIENNGMKAIDAVLDEVMQEDAFYNRLKEAFNDILLIRGYDGGGEGALSYEHFKTRLWYQDLNPRKGLSREDQQKLFPYSHPKMIAHTKLVRDYRDGMRREPLELIAYIVRNDRAFTELVTADYIMVSPYTSKGYGIYEELKGKFDDPDDPFEFIPTKIKALESRNGRKVQESATGFYPHAGLLSSFQYLKRYPTTETNRNRLRIRMYFEHFLGVDILQLAPRVNDAAAITAKYEIPTMQAADCVVCHKVMDPIAGLYQDFYVVDGKGIYGPRKEGWYEDMFAPGFDNKGLPKDERWRSLQWLGERTAKDPRFAVAMVKHVWYILTGRKPLLPPEDIDDPMFVARRRAYRVQRDEIEQIASLFAEADFNLRVVFKELVQSKFYRVDGLAAAVKDPRRRAELDDVGVVRMLTPEQLERKLTAVFGKKWGRLTGRESKFQILYGGIDSKQVTERLTDPSGAMGAIQRIMANDIACKNVAADFSLPIDERRLFPGIEVNVVPGANVASDQQIRRAIVHLHELLLGRFDSAEDPEVQRTYNLFAGIVKDAKSRKGIEPTESYFCQTLADKTPRDPDPDYTIRAWRAVVTYLLRQHEFLYE